MREFYWGSSTWGRFLGVEGEAELVAGRRGSGREAWGFVVIGAKREARGNEERRGRIGNWGVGSRGERL